MDPRTYVWATPSRTERVAQTVFNTLARTLSFLVGRGFK